MQTELLQFYTLSDRPLSTVNYYTIQVCPSAKRFQGTLLYCSRIGGQATPGFDLSITENTHSQLFLGSKKLILRISYK